VQLADLCDGREVALAEAEGEARADRRGLCAEEKPIPPGEWRSGARAAMSGALMPV
jgi:hypothetical protein